MKPPRFGRSGIPRVVEAERPVKTSSTRSRRTELTNTATAPRRTPRRSPARTGSTSGYRANLSTSAKRDASLRASSERASPLRRRYVQTAGALLLPTPIRARRASRVGGITRPRHASCSVEQQVLSGDLYILGRTSTPEWRLRARAMRPPVTYALRLLPRHRRNGGQTHAARNG
jgi:hypothetical protein